jgi:hypothetical protein
VSTKKGKYGSPRNRKALSYGDLLRAAQPTGISDPSGLGGSIAGPGGPHDRGAVVLDTTDAVLLSSVDVAMIEVARQGVFDGQAAFLVLQGRVNKTDRHASVGFVAGTDGVAAILTELLALSWRDSAAMLDDVTRRLTALHQDRNVDLHWLRAAIDNAIALAAEDLADEQHTETS